MYGCGTSIGQNPGEPQGQLRVSVKGTKSPTCMCARVRACVGSCV